YRHMVTLRLVSARMVDLQRSEKIAFHSSCLGEEAVIAAATLAARPNDWVFPGVREWGAALVRGLPIANYMHHAFGSGSDAAKGHSPPDHPPARAQHVAPASGVAGAHVPQAVGVAWAAKIKKDDVATIAIFGEGASSSGDFHNAVNFAGVFKPAVVFVCRNDGRERFASTRERALAYGVASATVDGSDALAVLTVVRAALARAVEGKGATLIEAITHPIAAGSPALAHVPTAAWASGGAELLSLGDADPLVRLRRVLEREKLAESDADEAIAKDVRAAIDAAVSDAERAGPPATSTLFDDVYAEVPAHLRAQKESSPWRR
ncbi:MAG: Branched-chain alpha-keto acid dehydrogenase, component, alpha subunit, partial [Myxococcaceae bacterium]|nr:Branched-chain alpha-keto acid dehydrogenase, component, alpha subunit [Myxococcaceae bacterium]